MSLKQIIYTNNDTTPETTIALDKPAIPPTNIVITMNKYIYFFNLFCLFILPINIHDDETNAITEAFQKLPAK